MKLKVLICFALVLGGGLISSGAGETNAMGSGNWVKSLNPCPRVPGVLDKSGAMASAIGHRAGVNVPFGG